MTGKLIVIEGLDGSGKSTQETLLKEKLSDMGIKVNFIKLPNYDDPACELVKMYLGGRFGKKAGDVNAYAASAFYAVDRFASYMKDWKEFYEREDSVVLATRYTSSNEIHQLAKYEIPIHYFFAPFFLVWPWWYIQVIATTMVAIAPTNSHTAAYPPSLGIMAKPYTAKPIRPAVAPPYRTRRKPFQRIRPWNAIALVMCLISCMIFYPFPKPFRAFMTWFSLLLRSSSVKMGRLISMVALPTLIVLVL